MQVLFTSSKRLCDAVNCLIQIYGERSTTNAENSILAAECNQHCRFAWTGSMNKLASNWQSKDFQVGSMMCRIQSRHKALSTYFAIHFSLSIDFGWLFNRLNLAELCFNCWNFFSRLMKHSNRDKSFQDQFCGFRVADNNS